MAPLAVNSIDPESAQGTATGPYIMSCGYCNWTTLDIGWQFEGLTNLHHQMSKLRIGGQDKATSRKPAESEANDGDQSEQYVDDEPDVLFASLRSFYNAQLSAANPSDPLLTPSGGYNYSSPASLARIMSLYTGRSFYGKKDQGRPPPMRESADNSEGLHLIDRRSDEKAMQKIRTEGWTGTASISQRTGQQQHPPRFADELRPLRAQLRTKRSKRCRTCRHILVKPEAKTSSVRFRIKLVAVNYIPTISLKPLQLPPSAQLPMTDLHALPSLRASQFLLTLKNPLFDPIKVTLATQTHTPGNHGHKVTILCPQFEVGSNIDQWDEALGDGKGQRNSRLLGTSKGDFAGGEAGKVAEAGKVWDKDRNWTTVVVEVVCAAVNGNEEAAEDEDSLEIPIFIRVEWEADVEREVGIGKVEEKKEKRELAYWVVIGVGRVAKTENSAKLVS